MMVTLPTLIKIRMVLSLEVKLKACLWPPIFLKECWQKYGKCTVFFLLEMNQLISLPL